MSDSSSVSATAQVADAWRSHRPYLVNLAYQMLGDIGEAEDIAQEAFLRLTRTGHGEIDDVRGWLTVVAGRLCLDQVRSARARHEQPREITALETSPPLNQSQYPDPADRVTLDDEVREALLEVMRRLSPGERVAFVLHDVFGIPFETIAETVGRPVGTCRQLARRAG
jgi:RNA polymerase sigma-70 factor (ECF subfamily)